MDYLLSMKESNLLNSGDSNQITRCVKWLDPVGNGTGGLFSVVLSAD